jgi:phage shock protein E
MRAWLLGALLAARLAVADETIIEPEALAARLQQQDTSLVLLDVRTREEFASGHIPGARNIPYDELPARVAELPPAAQQELFVYCAGGKRTENAIARLREQGYTRLVHLRGGFVEWQAKGLPQAKP